MAPRHPRAPPALQGLQRRLLRHCPAGRKTVTHSMKGHFRSTVVGHADTRTHTHQIACTSRTTKVVGDRSSVETVSAAGCDYIYGGLEAAASHTSNLIPSMLFGRQFPRCRFQLNSPPAGRSSLRCSPRRQILPETGQWDCARAFVTTAFRGLAKSRGVSQTNEISTGAGAVGRRLT